MQLENLAMIFVEKMRKQKVAMEEVLEVVVVDYQVETEEQFTQVMLVDMRVNVEEIIQLPNLILFLNYILDQIIDTLLL